MQVSRFPGTISRWQPRHRLVFCNNCFGKAIIRHPISQPIFPAERDGNTLFVKFDIASSCRLFADVQLVCKRKDILKVS